ncbi:MAG: hypothetical protein ACEQSR_03340 [Candidatus Methylacidiphilales bacterium]
MKKLLLLACGLVMACTNSLFAQKEGVTQVDLLYSDDSPSDTLVIKLSGNDKILIIGGNLKDLHKYKQVDSIKTLFLTDILVAQANNTLNAEATKVYYFVTNNGKRRLKAENVDLSENAVNVAYELKRLQLDLPKYEYHLFDLKNEYQIQIYLADAKQLKTQLENTNIESAINFVNTNAKKDFKRTFKLELATENGYKVTNKTLGRHDAIFINGALGLGLIGNTIAPVAGVDMLLYLSNKYSVGQYKLGIGYNAFPFVNTVNGDVKGVSLVNSYALKGLVNLNDRGDANYIGLQLGIMKSNDIKTFDNAFKFGILQQTKLLNYSFDFIYDSNKNWVYGLTVYFPF